MTRTPENPSWSALKGISAGHLSYHDARVRVSNPLRVTSRCTPRVTGWINHHNARREHTSINNMSPIEWES